MDNARKVSAAALPASGTCWDFRLVTPGSHSRDDAVRFRRGMTVNEKDLENPHQVQPKRRGQVQPKRRGQRRGTPRIAREREREKTLTAPERFPRRPPILVLAGPCAAKLWKSEEIQCFRRGMTVNEKYL